MPWKAPPVTELQREIHTLQMKLLRANAALRLKTIFAERLAYALHKRTERIDELTAIIDQLRATNKQLDQEAEHWAQMFATHSAPALPPKHNNDGIEDSLCISAAMVRADHAKHAYSVPSAMPV